MSILLNRMYDLIHYTSQTDIPRFSQFLDLHEQQLLYDPLSKENGLLVMKSSGFAYQERVMLGFFPYYYVDIIKEDATSFFPIQYLKITPSDKGSIDFNHRHVLGTITGMGYNRDTIGDIVVLDETAYIQVHEKIINSLQEELFQIGKQPVHVEAFHDMDMLKTIQPKMKRLKFTVATPRLDAVVKNLTHLGRSTAHDMIMRGQVKLNQAEESKVTRQIQAMDVISVRGHGKYVICKIGDITKKGRYMIEADKFV